MIHVSKRIQGETREEKERKGVPNHQSNVYNGEQMPKLIEYDYMMLLETGLYLCQPATPNYKRPPSPMIETDNFIYQGVPS